MTGNGKGGVADLIFQGGAQAAQVAFEPPGFQKLGHHLLVQCRRFDSAVHLQPFDPVGKASRQGPAHPQPRRQDF
jgi:hypothetical protein